MVVFPVRPGQYLQAIEKYEPLPWGCATAVHPPGQPHPDFKKYDLSNIKSRPRAPPLPVPVLEPDAQDFSGVVTEALWADGGNHGRNFNPRPGRAESGLGGLPIADTESKLWTWRRTNAVPPGTWGSVYQGPQVMQGLLEQAEEPGMSLRDGWVYHRNRARG